MSIKNYSFIVSILLFLLSCGNSDKTALRVNFSGLNETEKDSLAKQYDQIANLFLQPSDLYRKYNDSALMVQPRNVEIRQGLSKGRGSYKSNGNFK